MKTTYPQNCNQCGRESIVGDIANHWMCPYCSHLNSPYENANEPKIGGCLILAFIIVIALLAVTCSG